MRSVAALPAIALLVGSAAGLAVADVPRGPLLFALLVCVAVSTWALVRARTSALACGVAFGFFAGGALLSAVAWQRAWQSPLRAAFEREGFAIVEGTLRTDAARTENGVSLSVAVERVGQNGRDGRDGQDGTEGTERAEKGGIVVTVVGALAAERIDEWRAGRRIRFPAVLRRPSRYLDPGVPDHEREMVRRGTQLVGTVKSGALVEVLARGSWWRERLADARAFARRALAGTVGRWSLQSAAIVAAIVIGDRSALDDDVERRLQEAGTYHVIAISGGNIAILAGLLVGLSRAAGALGRMTMAAVIAVLIAYALLVGGGASVNRATLMAVVSFGARTFDQRSPPLNVLFVAAAALVIADPCLVVDPAFVLTFGATLAILTAVPAVDLTRIPKCPSAPVILLLASLAAEAALFPIGALLFSRVTFAGLALNFVAIPLMAVAQIAGMLVVPLAAIWPAAADAVGWVAHAGAVGLVWSSELVRFVPAVTWRVAPPAWTACAIYYAAVAVAWTRRRYRRTACALAIAAALWILVDPRVFVKAWGDGRLHLTFLDVGQGDAAFIVFPRGSTLLVDAGGLGFSSSFDIGDRIVAPVIRDAGFRRLDRVALSHGDPDHIGGALSILREFRPLEIWEGIPVPRAGALSRLRAEAIAIGARWSNVHAGDHIAIDGVEVVARHPGREDWERQKVRNEDSLVLELRWGDVSILLTGDIGRETERTLELPAAPLSIIKIPHHGSLTSSTPAFVNAVRPAIAVVSAGRNNHFGHPVPEVLGRYTDAGAEIFRTDRDGAIAVEIDGAGVHVSTFGSRRHLDLDLPRRHEDTK